jgi:outer membrane beta-barrel protein
VDSLDSPFFGAISIATGVLFSSPYVARAQTAAEPEVDIENLFTKEEQEPPPAAKTEKSSEGDKNTEIKDVSDLGKLSEFKDVAVIQRRYLPKTGRFEAFIGPTMVLNDVFFLNVGLNGRFAYYFRERYGVEFVGSWLTSSERDITSSLNKTLLIRTQSLLTPTGYYGLDFKWIPIYGKMTWKNRTITPFDLYFSLGGGQTLTNQDPAPTLHLGTGQTFAMSKAMAFRWDLSWNFFSATPKLTSADGTTTKGSSQVFNTLLLTVGMSFFFPEATYR